MPAPTRYRIAPLDVHAHLFLVHCTIDDPAPGGQRFTLPTWVPGSYLVREFARHFVAVRAEANGATLPIAKEAKDTWRAAPCAGPLTVTAEVYAFDLSVRAAYLDAKRGYFNGATMFLCPEGRGATPCEVEIVQPEFAGAREWQVATTLEPAGAALFGFGTYRASNYDDLIDHPVEMASFARAAFDAGGARHDITVTGRIHADLERVVRDLARICQWQIDLFAGASGGRAPFDRYLFQVTAVGDGYGGLEHRSSTSLLCRRDDLPAFGATSVSDGYRNFLGLASHEYFHSWNVKRIKPASFVPYDLAREAYTRQLWAFEGVTSYYDDLALVRSGVVEPASYLELLGRTVTTVLRTPGGTGKASRNQASTRGSSSTAPTRTRPMRSSATTRRARLSRSRSTWCCAAPALRSTRSCGHCGNGSDKRASAFPRARSQASPASMRTAISPIFSRATLTGPKIRRSRLSSLISA